MKDDEREGSRERDAEHSWKVEHEVFLLSLTRISKSGKTYTDSEKYTRGEDGTSSASIVLFEDDAKVEIIPYKLTVISINTRLKTAWGDHVVDKLSVGIKDETSVAFIFLRFAMGGRKISHQYFFDANGQPANFIGGGISIPNWPSEKPEVITDEMLPYFIKLGEVNPNISGSLRDSVIKLAKPPTNK